MLTTTAAAALKKNSKRGGLALVGAVLGFLGNAQFLNSYEDGYKQALLDVENGKVSRILYQTESPDIRMINPEELNEYQESSNIKR
jgi:hypothetical protein